MFLQSNEVTDLQVFLGPVIPLGDVAGPHLELEADDVTGHHQDSTRWGRRHSVDHNWSHVVEKILVPQIKCEK